jgi:hypothetical protein
MSPTVERSVGWLYVESLVIVAMLFPNRRDKATEQFLLALPAIVKRPSGLAATFPPVGDVVAALKSTGHTPSSLAARFRDLAAKLPALLDPEAARQWQNQARYLVRLRSHALGDPDEVLETLALSGRTPEPAFAGATSGPLALPLDHHAPRPRSGSSGRRHRHHRHRARWTIAALALACAAGAAWWLYGRDLVLPRSHLAELAQGCSIQDALGGTIWFGPTVLPESTRLSHAQACDVGEALAGKTRDFLRVRVGQICDPITDAVKNRFGGDYGAAMANAQRMASAGDPTAARAYATLARCRTDEARAGLEEDIRRELATVGIRYGVYSVGQFVADGRTCRGYVEQVRIESKSARGAPTPDTRYGLSGLGDCAAFRFAPEGLFDLSRRLEGLLPGDFIRQAFRYDGALPETWTFGGRGYNFVSASADGYVRSLAASGAPQLVRPSLEAPEGDVLKAFREIGRFEGKRLRDALVDPGLASAFWAVVPRGYEGCAVKLADSVGPLRRAPDGAIVFDAREPQGNRQPFAAAYIHPAGIIHIALDVRGCGRPGPAIAYFAAADPTELRPSVMDKWLASVMAPNSEAFWETDAGRRPLAAKR